MPKNNDISFNDFLKDLGEHLPPVDSDEVNQLKEHSKICDKFEKKVQEMIDAGYFSKDELDDPEFDSIPPHWKVRISGKIWRKKNQEIGVLQLKDGLLVSKNKLEKYNKYKTLVEKRNNQEEE